MKKLTLKDLAIKHPYYCSESNYFNNDCTYTFNTWPEFFDTWHDVDIDMNLIFRWDVHKFDESEAYRMEMFVIHQRTGVFASIQIPRIIEDDVDGIIKYLSLHRKKLNELWKPL